MAPYGANGLNFTEGMPQDNVEAIAVALQGEAAYRPLLEAERAEILQEKSRDLVASLVVGWGTSRPTADQAVLIEAYTEDRLTNLREALRFGVDGWIDDVLASVKPWGFDVTEIAVPSSLWYGDEDRGAPVGHGKWLAARIPGVVAHIEPGEGHVAIWLAHLGQILQELVALSSGRV